MANPNIPSFPGALPTDSVLMVATDGATCNMTSDIDSTSTNINVDSTSFNTPCIMIIENEMIVVTATVSGQLQGCIRGFSGTTAAPHPSGTPVQAFYFAWHHNQSAAEIKAICTLLGINGSNFVSRSSVVYNETPGGTQNGTNPTFNLAKAPNPPASLQLFRNGALLVQGSSAAYTISGSTITFNAGSIPGSTDVLRAFYQS